MFGDDQHSVNAQARTAERQRLGHGRVQRDPMPARAVPAEVAFGELVHVKAGEFQPGIMVASFPAVALQNAIDEMLRVGILAKFGGEDGNFLSARPAGFGICLRVGGAPGSEHGGGGG